MSDAPTATANARDSSQVVRCQACSAAFRAAAHLAGKQVNCTACGAMIHVPGNSPQTYRPLPLDDLLDDVRVSDASPPAPSPQTFVNDRSTSQPSFSIYGYAVLAFWSILAFVALIAFVRGGRTPVGFDWQLAFHRLFALLVLVGFPLAVVMISRFVLTPADRLFARCYSGIDFSPHRRPGDVPITFHTYFGFLVVTRQFTHKGYAPPPHARRLLWRLHCFNLTWGMLAYGALVIPILSYFNYQAQLRAIDR